MGSKPSGDRFVDTRDCLVAVRFSGNGTVAALFETPEPGLHVGLQSVDVVAGKGFAGDHAQKSHWRGAYVPGREVSACAIEVLEALGVDPGVVGDNLVTRGLDLRSLKPGQHIAAGEVLLQRSEREHRPCATFRDRTSDRAFEIAAEGHRGALFVVLRGGQLRRGDAIRLVNPNGNH